MITVDTEEQIKIINYDGVRLGEMTMRYREQHPEHSIANLLMSFAKEMVKDEEYLLEALKHYVKMLDFYFYSIIVNYDLNDSERQEVEVGSIKGKCYYNWNRILTEAYKETPRMNKSKEEIRHIFEHRIDHKVDVFLYDLVDEINGYSPVATLRDFLMRNAAWEQYLKS